MQSAPPSQSESIGQPVGDYRLARVLGQGRLGSVYEATHQVTGQRCAIRLLSPTLSRSPQVMARFPYEARAVSLVHHASLCELREFGVSRQGVAFLVMEYLEGETLRARLAQQGRLSEEEALTVGRQVARALSVAHAADIAHGNLNPAQLWLVQDPWKPGARRAKVVELGLLRVATGGGETAALARAVGSPPYLAPEQRAAVGSGPPADVYALGVIIYEMLAGHPPFPGTTLEEVEAAQAHPAPSLRELNPTIPQEMARLVDRMMARAPTDRPSMGEVAEELDRMDAFRATLAYTPVEVPQEGSSRPQVPGRGTMAWAQLLLQQRREERRKDKEGRAPHPADRGRGLTRRVLLGLMGASMLFGIGGGVAYLMRRRPEEPSRPPASPPASPLASPSPPPTSPVATKEPSPEEQGEPDRKRRRRDRGKRRDRTRSKKKRRRSQAR